MPDVKNPSLGPGQIPVLTTVTPISSAQILALQTTPVTVIPAPGAGNLIIVRSAVAVYSFNTIAYAGAIDIIGLFYSNGGNSQTSNAAWTNLVKSTNSAFAYAGPSNDPAKAILPGADNKAMVLQSAVNYTAGNGTLKIVTYYNIVPVP